MSRRISIVVVALLVAAGVRPAEAGNRSGTVSELFLRLPVSARVVGVGGAEVALSDGIASIGYNASGILSIADYGVAATYSAWFAGISHRFFGAAANLGDLGVVGGSVTTLTTDDMPITTPAFPEGTGQYFRASDYAFSLCYARQVSDKFSIGINGKYIDSFLFNTAYGASSFAFDIGTLYQVPIIRTTIGVSLTNLGNDIRFINETYSLPTTLYFGALVDLYDAESGHVTAAFQVSRPNDSDEQYNLGGEYTFSGRFSLRAGYKFGYDAQSWAAGFGVRLDAFGLSTRLDYGYNQFQWLSGTHTVSVAFEL